MKQVLSITLLKKSFQLLPVSVALFVTLLIPGLLTAQTDSTQKKELKATEEASLIAPAVDFVSVQKSDKTIDLKVALKAKVKGVFIKLPLLKVTFIQISGDNEKELGFVITNEQGKALLNVKADSFVTNKEGKLQFKAVFAGNKQMDPADGEVTIKRAWLEIVPVKEDSLLTVKAKLIIPGAETDSSVKDIAIGIYVKRLFNPLKVGEGTTDGNGEASVEIPAQLPGDDKGNINLLARIDENELFGNLEATVTQKWGVPVSDKLNQLPRALWGTHPPVWMLVTFIILMTVVWGHYIVIIYELFRLRKEEPHELQNTSTV